MTATRPLKVCYLVAYFHPFESGAERQALAQGTELARLGHEVHVVTHSMPSVPRDEVIRGISVHRWIRSYHKGPLFGLSFVASTLRALRRLRRETGFDVLHTHQGLWEGVAAGLARKTVLSGIPTMVQPASSGYYGEAEELQRTKGWRFLRKAILANDAFVAISADIEKQWRALGVPESSMFRIASGVDSRHYAPGESHLEAQGLLPPRPRVVFTGRLHPQKNLDVLVNAWPAVAQATGANLVLVGKGTERQRLEALAEERGVAGRVTFLGAVDDVAAVLKAADLFVLPSVAEGMSNSLLEAMATGLPCVASDIGGNQDLLGVGGAGVLVAGSDPGRWAEALMGLLEDPERCRHMGNAARARIEGEFSLERVVARYVELYERLIGEVGKSSGPNVSRA